SSSPTSCAAVAMRRSPTPSTNSAPGFRLRPELRRDRTVLGGPSQGLQVCPPLGHTPALREPRLPAVDLVPAVSDGSSGQSPGQRGRRRLVRSVGPDCRADGGRAVVVRGLSGPAGGHRTGPSPPYPPALADHSRGLRALPPRRIL